MPETINWKDLTPTERNELIEQKVFDFNPILNKFHVAPRYSETFENAWKIFQKFNEEKYYEFQTAFMDVFMETGHIDDACCNDWDTCGLTFQGLARLTPDAICIAALKALGYTIIQ